MTPVVEGMAAQAPDAETGRALWWAFALGACFSAATARRSPRAPTSSPSASRSGRATPISFWRFTRYGIVVTLLSTVLAWVYVWLRYF